MLNVHVISKEAIKPSPSTPKHLSSMPLSLLDQIAPLNYTRILLFYTTTDDVIRSSSSSDVEKGLKDSLSKTLTHFYPLAGRIKEPVAGSDNTGHVDCNDAGAEFFSARVEGDLGPVLSQPPIEDFKQLLPGNSGSLQYGDPLLAVQLNVFDCGGFVLGLCVSHQVADAASMGMLLSCWAAVARGEEVHPLPIYNTASVFPPNSRVRGSKLEEYEDSEAVFRNFVIKATELEKLRGDASAYVRELAKPTRVEAVSMLIWRCISRARGEPKNGSLLMSIHAVNVRKRVVDQLSDCSFGNAICAAVLRGDGVEDFCDRSSQGVLEKRLRNVLSSVNEEYVRGFVEQYVAYQNNRENLHFDPLTITSWCRFPFYKTDIGWGEPAWFSCVLQDVKNTVVLTDLKDNNGVELWVALEKEEMERLVKDPEFLGFTSPSSY